MLPQELSAATTRSFPEANPAGDPADIPQPEAMKPNTNSNTAARRQREGRGEMGARVAHEWACRAVKNGNYTPRMGISPDLRDGWRIVRLPRRDGGYGLEEMSDMRARVSDIWHASGHRTRWGAGIAAGAL